MNNLKKGDWIKCHDEEDLKKWLSILGREGYGAVASPGMHILITSAPEGEEVDDGSV